MGAFGGGIQSVLHHRHFWKVIIIFLVLIVGLRAWHYYKIRHDAASERDSYQRLEKERLEFQLKR